VVRSGQLSTPPRVYVVLPVHNRRAITVRFCDCLTQQSHANFVLILVDDGSTDGTAETVALYPFRKSIVRSDGSLWWAGGLRRGTAHVRALNPRYDDVLWFVNDDTAFGRNFLAFALKEIDSAGRGIMLAVPVVFTDSGKRSEGGFRCYWPRFTFHDYGRHAERIDCASTRCLLIRWGDFEQSGGFRPGLLPHYLSDLEFTIRARRRAIRIVPADSVSCCSTENTSGLHRVPAGPARAVVRFMFSNRFSANPLHLFMFILLSAPVFWKLPCWFFAARSSFLVFINSAIFLRLGRKQ
jgi:GT2 family glycosyltransferase